MKYEYCMLFLLIFQKYVLILPTKDHLRLVKHILKSSFIIVITFDF